MPRLPLFPLLVALAAAPSACAAAHPARFAEARPVLEIADDAPIPVPQRLVPLDAIYVTEVYIRRPILFALDPARTPEAGDVNALDDVPRSSWFDPREIGASDGPPVLPLRVLPHLPESGLDGLAVTDARGIRYELRRDPPARPELTTASAAIASHLLRDIGYFTPDVWVIDVRPNDLVPVPAPAEKTRGDEPPSIDAFLGLPLLLKKPAASTRVAAVRWPIGIDVGTTPSSESRTDDPNDQVPHPDRRTLRALKTALYWIGMGRLWPGSLRDAYVGEPGRGHLQHYVVALEDALGSDAVTHPDTELDGEPALRSFLTLGLLTRRPPPPQKRWPSLGEFSPDKDPAAFHTGPPFEPIDRVLPGDIYWMAKRIQTIPWARVVSAIEAGRMYDTPSRARVAEVLAARRQKLVRDAYERVTPCEVLRVEPGRISLRDEGIVERIATAGESRYAIAYLDSDGAELAPRSWLKGEAEKLVVPVPPGKGGYVVVRVTAERGGKAAPRAMEVHLVRSDTALRLVGVRH